MKRSVIFIKTVDTKKEYEFERNNSTNDCPQLWEVIIMIACVNDDGSSGSHYGDTKCSVYVERETLENSGLVPRLPGAKKSHKEETTAEDLVLKLLEHVGVYPEQ